MQNGPQSAGNPALPVDAEAAKKTREDRKEGKVEGLQDTPENEKEASTSREDAENFNLDKVDDLQESKKGEKED